jgi:hypothetical protein
VPAVGVLVVSMQLVPEAPKVVAGTGVSFLGRANSAGGDSADELKLMGLLLETCKTVACSQHTAPYMIFGMSGLVVLARHRVR